MKQYIDKAAVVAGINDWRNKIKKGIFLIPLSGSDRADATFEYEVLGKVISFLDTLEAKKVDLLKEIANQYENYEDYLLYEEFADIAKYFFELGLKAQKGK